MLFLVVLFFIKNGLFSKNQENKTIQQEGLTYKNEVIGDLVSRDTDGDGVPDWEEGLWGTDPTKKQTTPGVSDSVAIQKLKAAQKASNQANGVNNVGQTPEKLTQTDQFSRDLFTTIASLNQNGAMDQATADKISSSLADKIQNSPPRKIFLISDIKVIKDSSKDAIHKYLGTLNASFKKYPTQGNVLDIFKKATNEDGSLNATALSELDPILKSKQAYIKSMLEVNTPEILSSSHLGVLNALEILVENLNDIEVADSDVIVAFSAISQYQNNLNSLDSALKNLANIINQKLNN